MTNDPTLDPEEIRIDRSLLQDVHTVEVVPHVHMIDDGKPVAVHALPGDTPRSLLTMGLAYVSLALALHERAGYGWDDQWAPPPGATPAELAKAEDHTKD
jgi:hypothetical protein